MAVYDAQIARGMAQRIERAIPAIQQNFIDQNALLKLAMNEGRIKWGGYHTEFEWYVRKETGATPVWGAGGELGIRTFEELNPANRAHLPYCWLEKSYAVSEKTIEANKNASGSQKIYDVLKEQLILAQINMYNAIKTSIYGVNADGGGDGGTTPVGLWKVLGSPYTGGSAVTGTALSSYANITLNTSAIAAYSTKKAGYDSPQWAPFAADLQERPGASTDTWVTKCFEALAWAAGEMEVTQDVSGTGKVIKPDIALMNAHNFADVVSRLVAAQATGYQIPLSRSDVVLGGFPNVIVGPLTCIKDTNVPNDRSAAEGTATGSAVFLIHSKDWHVCTTHTKSEGLISNEFRTDEPLVSGAYGVLKANLGYMVASPCAVGVILGCD